MHLKKLDQSLWLQKRLQFLFERVLFKEIMVIIQTQKLLIFLLQQTVALKLLKLQFQYLRVYLEMVTVIKKQV